MKTLVESIEQLLERQNVAATIDYTTARLTLIYLDQCVFSSLLDRPRNATWSQVRDLLFEGNRQRKFLCPYSLEHIVETAAMRPEDAAEVDSLARRLSLGQSLRLEFILVASQIASSMRGLPMSLTELLEPNQVRPLSDPEFRERMLRGKLGLDAFNSKKMELQNHMNKAFRDGRSPSSGVSKAILDLRSDTYTKRLIAELDVVLRTGRARIEAVPDAPHMPTWASLIIYILIRLHQPDRAELLQLRKRLVDEGAIFIPFLRTKIILEAAAIAKQQKIEPSDQYDNTRVACALPFADILVTDGGIAAGLREVRLDAYFATDVFSTKDAERQALTARLQRALEAKELPDVS